MPRKTSFLAKQSKEIQNRLAELRPHYEEYLHLQKLESALEDLVEDLGTAVRRVTGGRRPGRPRKATAARRRPGRPRKAAAAKRAPGRPRKTAAAKRGRAAARPAARARRRGTTRADQTLSLIKNNPGITVTEIGKRLGVRQNYLYRVVNSLQSQGAVRRRGRGLHPA